MSRVYFTSRSGGEAELRGWERAYCAGLAEDLFVGLLGDDSFASMEPEWRLIPESDSKTRQKEQRVGGLAMWFKLARNDWDGSKTTFITLDGEKISPYMLMMNTALAVGNLPIQFMTVLNAQCEIHGYMEGEDRAWIASIIRDGRASGIMRPNSGWEEVATFLEAADDEPVVTSYSVTESFPNFHLAYDGMGDLDDLEYTTEFKAWEGMTHEQRWDRSMEGLRASEDDLRWQERGWAERWFGDVSKRLTYFDFRRNAMEIEEARPGTSYGRIYTKGPDGRFPARV